MSAVSSPQYCHTDYPSLSPPPFPNHQTHLELSGRTSSLKVTQFHYTAWPDRGVPQSPQHFLAFRNAVADDHQRCASAAKAAGDPRSPILVHCSAGVGRTGTFCCVHSCLNLLPFINFVRHCPPVSTVPAP